MKIAIISVSKKGYELSLLLKKHLDKDSTIINTDIYYKDVKNTFKLLFYEYDAISTLSGHLGGANKLTSKVANMLNATEVITTATDVNKKLGVDVIAKDLYLTVKNPNEIIYFNKAILNKFNCLLILQEQYQKESDELASIRDWLLPMLMNGQAAIED